MEEAICSLDSLCNFFKEREKELIDSIKSRKALIDDKEHENRTLRERANMLEIGAREHEKENARIMFVGFIVGAVIGAVFALIF